MSKAPAAPRRAVAICWFRREDYPHAKAAMADPERLYENYDEWLREAQAFEKEMAEQGIKTTRVRFDPVGFGVFCAARGFVPDGGARAEWAAYEATRKQAAGRP